MRQSGRTGCCGDSIESRLASPLCPLILVQWRFQVALAFVNDSCVSTHGNLRVNSCFISPSGEWKLGGFELLSSPKDDAAVLYVRERASRPKHLLINTLFSADSGGFDTRCLKLGLTRGKEEWIFGPQKVFCYFLSLSFLFDSCYPSQDPAAADAYALGLLLHAVFNPNQGSPATAQPPHAAPLPSSRGSIPTSVFPSFKKLLNPNPKARTSPKHFLAIGMAESPGEGSGFFANNKLVKICLGLDNFSLGSEAEKAVLLRSVGYLPRSPLFLIYQLR